MALRLALGLLAAALVTAIALGLRALSVSGAVAAAAVGAVAVAAGWSWGVLLMVFFISTSALSAVGAGRKQAVADSLEKGSRRDAVQVLSNGGVFALAAIAWLWTGSTLWLAAGAGAIATAACDSWATEIGVWLGGEPRSIATGRRMARGASGGVSGGGTAGGIAGAAVISGTMLIIGWPPHVAAAAAFAGVLGMLTDSILGATLQAARACTTCGRATERAVHCDRPTSLTRGAPWMNNDAVNAIATLVGAAMAAALVAGGVGR